MHTINERKLLMLKPNQIRIPSNRPRKNIDPLSLKKLADSISLNGVIQPITICKNRDGYFELISGERRLRAAAMANLRRIPCVLHSADTATCAIYNVTENLQREPLGFFEEAAALERLIKVHGLSYTETALRLGITKLTLTEKLMLLKLNEGIQRQIASAGLSEQHARALLLLPEYQQHEVLSTVIAENLNLYETEQLIEAKLHPQIKEEPPVTQIEEPVKPIRKYSIGDVRFFANSLAKLTDTLKSAGVNVTSRKTENDKYIEYKIRIKKEPTQNGECRQLKIC